MLSVEAREALKLARVAGRKRLRDWIPLLSELATFDEGTEAALKRTRVLLIMLWVITPILAVVGLITFAGGTHMVEAAVLGVVVVGLLVGIVATFIWRHRLRARDIHNEVREALVPTLEALAEDIAEKGKVALDISLPTTHTKKHRVSRERMPFLFPHLIESIYRQRLCTGCIPLRSGTELSFCIDREVTRYDLYRVSRSGKRKHKVKWRSLTTVETALRPPAGELCFDQAGMADLTSSGKVKQREKNGREVCRLVKRFKVKSRGTAPPEDTVAAAVLISMFMQLCAVTRPASTKQVENA